VTTSGLDARARASGKDVDRVAESGRPTPVLPSNDNIHSIYHLLLDSEGRSLVDSFQVGPLR